MLLQRGMRIVVYVGLLASARDWRRSTARFLPLDPPVYNTKSYNVYSVNKMCSMENRMKALKSTVMQSHCSSLRQVHFANLLRLQHKD